MQSTFITNIWASIFKKMEQQSTRQQKVASLIQKDFSALLTKEAAGLVHGSLVTVSAVTMSPDLSLARVYLSIFPFANAQATLKKLRTNVPFLRLELGKKVKNQLRIVPEIALFLDDSLERLEHLEKLMEN
ncbi:Ribosome-binding factor A [Mucinivorans hirudinis]|uniref:Ribosome-binding factor A n=1 Tax=Mucinivorans hirudinis TaxID=1433126 RepID=A0A060RBH2_9BACT|nr:Ribosome-binding factor A [Mucinivorans hirudinis]